MNEFLRPLIQRAVLEIVDYSHTKRTEMVQLKRKLPYCVMSYLKTGEALLRVNGKEYHCGAGDAIFVPPNVEHDHIKLSREETEFMWWHFNFRTSYNIDVSTLMNLPYKVHIQNTSDFERKFIAYLEAIENEVTISDMIHKNAKAMEILACVFDNFLLSESMEAAFNIPQIFVDIFEDVTSAPRADMSLTTLSRKYHMSPTYISNKFKDYYGISPIFLQRNMLFERAKIYLISTEKGINEISDLLGFSEHAVFTRFFTKRAKISPKEFRDTNY